MSWLEAASGTIVRLIGRYLPDPFVFAILMTIVALVLALLVTPATHVEALVAWAMDWRHFCPSSPRWR